MRGARSNIKAPFAVITVFIAAIIPIFTTVTTTTILGSWSGTPVLLAVQYVFTWGGIIGLLVTFADTYQTGTTRTTRFNPLLIPLHVFLTTVTGMQALQLLNQTSLHYEFLTVELVTCGIYLVLYYYVRPTVVVEIKDKIMQQATGERQ